MYIISQAIDLNEELLKICNQEHWLEARLALSS